ncbi:MAG: hypothetical protein HYV36_04325 [Lentisphaerae bacterium]|nr:hypothetical protein [Lentisphaerota bacterium]
MGITILMLPVLAWVWLAARDPVISVFSGTMPSFVLAGEIFSEPFDIVHAGDALDQPTIGKWLFLLTVMTLSSLPYAAAVRWLSNRARGSAYLAYAVCAVILGVFLLCILAWPLFWLIQYVASMGFTPRRILGLLYAFSGGILVIGFIALAFKQQTEITDRPARAISTGWHAAAVCTAVLGLLAVLVNWPTWAGKYYCLKRIDHQEVAQACSDLLRNTQFSNDYDSVWYVPGGQNWQSLPPGLWQLDLQEGICVSRHGIALRKTREVILVFKQSRTNSAVFELTLNGELLCPLGSARRSP